MKRLAKILILGVFFFIAVSGCEDTWGDPDGDYPCGYHNGKRLYKGPQGGCYYINSNGNKTYVDRSECNC